MAERLDGTVALVTGASSGIGEATAEALAAQGAAVAVAARRKERLDELVSRISENGGNAHIQPGDLLTSLFPQLPEICSGIVSHVNLLRGDYHVAAVYTGQGQYTRALRMNAEVFAGMERAGLEIEAAWVALNMLECHLGLNRDAEALELAEETVARFERFGTPTEVAKARFYSAVALARLGDRAGALARLDAAAAAFAYSGQAGQLNHGQPPAWLAKVIHEVRCQ